MARRGAAVTLHERRRKEPKSLDRKLSQATREVETAINAREFDAISKQNSHAHDARFKPLPPSSVTSAETLSKVA